MQYSPDTDEVQYYDSRYLDFFNNTESSDNQEDYGVKGSKTAGPQIETKSW